MSGGRPSPELFHARMQRARTANLQKIRHSSTEAFMSSTTHVVDVASCTGARHDHPVQQNDHSPSPITLRHAAPPAMHTGPESRAACSPRNSPPMVALASAPLSPHEQRKPRSRSQIQPIEPPLAPLSPAHVVLLPKPMSASPPTSAPVPLLIPAPAPAMLVPTMPVISRWQKTFKVRMRPRKGGGGGKLLIAVPLKRLKK